MPRPSRSPHVSPQPSDAYAFKPFPGSSHHWALREVERLASGPLKVLDVGAAGGHISREIRALRKDPVTILGVDPASPAPQDWPASDVWVSSIEEIEDTDCDLALALDVLEHVGDPAELLHGIASRCRPGGTILLSVPNVAHWSVRAQLAVGRFNYADRGILDRTHLRFFTRRSFLELITASGLTIVSTGETVVPLELLLPRPVSRSTPWRMARSARRLAARAFPGLWGFQLLVRARA